MAHLEEISVEKLQEHLKDAEDKRAILRLVAGINYKKNIPALTIAEWYDVSESTVHNWMNRLERLTEEPVEDVLQDAPRSGRPRKLSSQEWYKLQQYLENSPGDLGINAPHWTPKIVRELIKEEFDTEYSKRHVQDLLHEAGYMWKTARPGVY